MQSVWKLIKQNRGKIVVGGLAVGAVYLIHNALSRMNTEHVLERSHVEGRTQISIRARREYIFDTNHRSCDDSLIKFLKFLKDRLEREFNVDLLVEQLRTSSLSNEQRKNLWINVEVTSFSRIFALAYAMSLVTLSVKTQVSILASEICLHNEGVVKETWWNRLMSSVFYNDGDLDEGGNSELTAAVRNVFLKLIQYCLDEGTGLLFEKVRSVCDRCLSDVALNSVVDIGKLKQIVENIMEKSEEALGSRFSKFIIPDFVDQHLNSESQQLFYLLERLRKVLTSDECRRMLKILLDYYITSFIEIMDSKLGDKNIPMAKLLPAVTDSFDTVTQSVPGSPLHKFLVSVELHEFSKKVFLEYLPSSG